MNRKKLFLPGTAMRKFAPQNKEVSWSSGMSCFKDRNIHFAIVLFV